MSKKDPIVLKIEEIFSDNSNLKLGGYPLPSFFAYNQVNKNLCFVFNGTPYDCRSKAQFKMYTFARMISGLNHMLAFFYDVDKPVYDRICSLTYMNILNVHNLSIDLLNKSIVTIADRIKAIKEGTVISKEFCYYIMKYVNAVSDNVIDEKSATTSLTLSNKAANILAAVSVVIKFNYLLSGLLRGTLVYDRSVEYVIDSILNNVIGAASDYYKEKDSQDLFDSLDSYIYNLGQKIFNDSTKTYYRNKFEMIGKNEVRIATTRRIMIIASLRSYFPKLKDKEIAKKYTSKEPTKEVIDELMDNMYFNPIYSDWRDFTFNTVNMAAYFNTALRRMIKSQDLSVTIPDINQISFLQDENDDSRSISAQFDDKKKHLYNLRRDTMEYIIREFVYELKFTPVDFRNKIKYFICNKKHNFNTFIIYKILLCLTGEAKTYYNVLGIHSKLILALFYYRIKNNPNLVMFHDMIDIMFMSPTEISSISEEYLESILEVNGFREAKYKKAKNIFVIYSLQNQQKSIDPQVFASFLNLIEEPKKLELLLFPNLENNIPKEIKDNEFKVDNVFDKIDKNVRNAAYNYLMNKSIEVGIGAKY